MIFSSLLGSFILTMQYNTSETTGPGYEYCHVVDYTDNTAYFSDIFYNKVGMDSGVERKEFFRAMKRAHPGIEESNLACLSYTSAEEAAKWRANQQNTGARYMNMTIVAANWTWTGTSPKGPPQANSVRAQNTTPGASFHNRPELYASRCVTISAKSTGILLNNCAYPVALDYCVTNAHNAFTCGNNGHIGQGVGTISAHGQYQTGVGSGQLTRTAEPLHVRWMACRGTLGSVSPQLTQIDPGRGRCMSY
jgi:hypothetical protein